jgi:fucokinase
MSTTATSPFDVIVVTSPDDLSALAARELISSSFGLAALTSPSDDSCDKYRFNEHKINKEGSPLFLSSCDPYGTKLGSGGGTIAALAEAEEAWHCHLGAGDDSPHQSPTVLICHAGGESSRCPTQIALGKAWTSLPIVKHPSSDDGVAELQTVVSNPTELLVGSLSRILANVPSGSIVVAASDVLLSFGEDEESLRMGINFDGEDGVIGLAVPAPLSTAQNHGVFVAEDNMGERSNNWRISKVQQVLQKPSILQMMETPSCAFSSDIEDCNDDEKVCAWIDTGVIVFLPAAASALRELSASTLRLCTRCGLLELYRDRYRGDIIDDRPDINDFAKSNAPKMCLYGEMLHALRTSLSRITSDGTSGSSYMSVLSQHELKVCVFGTGSFIHLGTTAELVNFITSGSSVVTNEDSRLIRDSAVRTRRRYQRFGAAMGLTNRADAFVSGFHCDSCQDSVVVNSVIRVEVSGYIGKSSVVEHCYVDGAADIHVGDGCVVSGIRGSASLSVRDGLCLQLLPLRQSLNESLGDDIIKSMNAASFVCICIGVHDSIKDVPAKTLFGLDLQFVLTCGIDVADLWDESIEASERMLWNARILPVLTTAGNEIVKLNYSFLDWIQFMWTSASSFESDSDKGVCFARAMSGLKQWKESKRLSLSQIRTFVDSKAEARYRSSIPLKLFEDRRLAEVSSILTNRRHEHCNFDYVDFFPCSAKFMHAMHTLDLVASKAFSDAHFDVAGRSFAMMKLLIENIERLRPRSRLAASSSDKNRNGNIDGKGLDQSMREIITMLRSSQSENVVTSVASLRDSLLASATADIVACCGFLEQAASSMTERCVSGNTNAPPLWERTTHIPIGTTATATAPARIDLAGGWTDTPPISFEYGGKVACLAVLVDGKRPLKAHCRLVKGCACIRLRTEHRSLADENLLSFAEVLIQTLGDLANYCKPEADCSLLMCALIQLGFTTPASIGSNNNHSSIQSNLMDFCRTGQSDVGLEIVAVSYLPTGSGMGGSSIIAGCVIAAIAKCVGITLAGIGGELTQEIEINGPNSIIHSVLMVEQLLTTGGGWQDNIGGIVGGLKLGTSDPHVLPLQTTVQRVHLPPYVIDDLNKRLLLCFSGQPRLAKDILQQVLQRWATRSDEIMNTVKGLIQGASEAITCLESGKIDDLGRVMNQYWQLKMAMAGRDSGAEPTSVRFLIDFLTSKRCIVGALLSGAGGGGFLALLASEGLSRREVEATVRTSMDTTLDAFSFHSCTVSKDGLLVS